MTSIRRLARAQPVKKRGGALTLLQAKKGVQNRCATLLAREVLKYRPRPASTVAEKAAHFTDQAIRDWEKSQDQRDFVPLCGLNLTVA